MKSNKAVKRAGLAAAGVVAGGVMALGGSALASAESPSPSPSASANTGTDSGGSNGHGTAVTGDELAKVTAATKAKDSSVTITDVHKDADGSYDVFGTKNGTHIEYEVSADLKTFTESTGGGGRGHGGSPGTPVTGDELAKVTAATKANDSSFTVTNVHKDTDGSYDVFGTKNGANIEYEVSADLKTFTQNTRPGR